MQTYKAQITPPALLIARHPPLPRGGHQAPPVAGRDRWGSILVGCCLLFVICNLLAPLRRGKFGISYAQAQENVVGLSISPTLDVVDLHDHDPLVLAFTIENVSSIDLDVTPSMRTFHADNQTGTPILDDPQPIPFVEIQTPGFSLGKPFTLPVGQKQQLVLRIVPPPNLKHDLTLTLLAKGSPTTLGTLTGSSSKTTVTIIGAHMILRATQSTADGAVFTLSEVHKPFLLDVLAALDARFLVQNTDVTTHQVHGTLTLKRGGNVVEAFALAPDFILPQSGRWLRVTKDILGEKTPQAPQFTTPLIPWKYNLELALADETGNLKTYTYAFYVIPIVIFALAIGLVAAYWILKSLLVDRRQQI